MKKHSLVLFPAHQLDQAGNKWTPFWGPHSKTKASWQQVKTKYDISEWKWSGKWWSVHMSYRGVKNPRYLATTENGQLGAVFIRAWPLRLCSTAPFLKKQLCCFCRVKKQTNKLTNCCPVKNEWRGAGELCPLFGCQCIPMAQLWGTPRFVPPRRTTSAPFSNGVAKLNLQFEPHCNLNPIEIEVYAQGPLGNGKMSYFWWAMCQIKLICRG